MISKQESHVQAYKHIYKWPNLIPVDLDVALVMRDLQEDQAATNRCRRHLSHLK